MVTQVQLRGVKQAQVENTKMQFADSVSQRHAEASAIINNAIQNIFADKKTNADDITLDNEEIHEDIEVSQEECEKIQDSINEINNSIDNTSSREIIR